VSKRELNQVLGHGAESDGIEEYDNPMPNWWVGLFYLTIIWAVGYVAYYHFIAKKSYVKALSAQVAEAEARWPRSTQLARVEQTPAAIAAGEAVFQANCVACHGANLQGGIGPNLVDSTWVHGRTPEEIVATITNGVAAKGMPTWGPILGNEKIGEVAAYIISKQ
jgi:cytochrome c oxidase cbb3-type subunit 3